MILLTDQRWVESVFSDRLNRKYDNSAFRKSAGKLFDTLVAAAAKVLSPKQLQVRWTVSVLVSAERSVGDKLTIIGKVSRGMTGKDRSTSVAILNTTRCQNGNQCS